MSVAVQDHSGKMCSSTLYRGNIHTFSFELQCTTGDIASFLSSSFFCVVCRFDPCSFPSRHRKRSSSEGSAILPVKCQPVSADIRTSNFHYYDRITLGNFQT